MRGKPRYVPQALCHESSALEKEERGGRLLQEVLLSSSSAQVSRGRVKLGLNFTLCSYWGFLVIYSCSDSGGEGWGAVWEKALISSTMSSDERVKHVSVPAGWLQPFG